MRIQKTKIKEPDMIEIALVGISIIWVVSALWLIREAATMKPILEITWTSLTTFFMGFSSITLLVIAILLADIRKSL